MKTKLNQYLLYTECNDNITGYSGVIESPNFPNDYPGGYNCTWKITVPKGNKINITFSHFWLEGSLSAGLSLGNGIHFGDLVRILKKTNTESDNCTSDFVEVFIRNVLDFENF